MSNIILARTRAQNVREVIRMKRWTTLILKVAIVLFGAFVVVFCAFGLSSIIMDLADSAQNIAKFMYPIIVVMYIAAVPILIALYQSFKFLNFVDKNMTFTEQAIKTLKTVRYCAMTMAGLHTVAFPFFAILGELDDAPGAIVIGFGFIFVPIVIATFVNLIEGLFKQVMSGQN